MKLLVGSFMLTLICIIVSPIAVEALNISQWNLSKYQHKTIDAAVTRYYERKTFMMSIGVCLEYSRFWHHYVLDFLTDALTHSRLLKYDIFMKSTNRLQRVTKVSYHNLWYVDSYRGFSSLLVAVKNDFNDNMGEFFIIMNTARSLSQERELQLILEKSFELNIVDVVVAVYMRNSTFKLYSYDIFHPHHCRKVVVEQVNVFKNGHFQNEEIFPYKFENFNNCPITIYIRNSSLFYRFNLNQDGTQITTIEGVEATMIQTMAKKLNLKIHIFYDKNHPMGNVYENGTTVGPFRFLNEHKLDILLGYYQYPVRRRYFGESDSYVFMPLVVVVSEHDGHKLNGMWLLKPFSPMTWLIFGLLSLLVVVMVQLCHYYLRKTVTWIDIVGLVLGNSRPLRIKSYTIKVSFSVCIFGTMILCATFQGRLYDAFNSGNLIKVTNIQQLVEANYTFLLRQNVEIDLIHSLYIPFKQIRFMDAVDDYVIYENMRTYPGNVATLTNYWDFQMYIESTKCYNEFDIIPMIVILNQICAYMRNQSYLIKPVNRFIYSLKFSGILNKWMQNLTSVDRTNEIELNAKHQMSKTPLPLTSKTLEIVFAGLIFFYLISILTFLCEFVVSYLQKFVNKF